MTVAAVLDASVLYPIGLRDVLFGIALEEEMYRPKWTAAILNEVQRHLITAKDLPAKRAAQVRRAINAVFPDAEVTGYEHLVEEMTNVPDAGRPVLAAAVSAGAEIIVSSNTQNFPTAVCAAREIRLYHPDDFLVRSLQLNYGVVDVVHEVAARYSKHGKATGHDELFSRLFQVAPKFAAQLIAQEYSA